MLHLYISSYVANCFRNSIRSLTLSVVLSVQLRSEHSEVGPDYSNGSSREALIEWKRYVILSRRVCSKIQPRYPLP